MKGADRAITLGNPTFFAQDKLSDRSREAGLTLATARCQHLEVGSGAIDGWMG